MVDYYEEFGLDRSMSCGEIQAKLFEEKKSWSRKQNAPSLDKRQEAERKIEEIAKCMSIFESEEKRHAYDEELNYFRAEEAKNQQGYTEYPVPQVNTVPQVATQMPRQPMSAEQKKRIRNLIIIGSAATTFVIILFIVLISVYVRIATTINLDQYISAEFSGYDGYGTVRLVMDTQALKKKTRFADTLFDNYFSKGIVSECEDNPNGQLYNGDKVNVVFNIDEKAIYQKFRLRIKYSDDLSYKVNGLVELNKKEVFDGVNVVFSGISTNGTAEVEISDSLFNGDVRYSLDKSEGLKNGDTVTVYLQCDDEDVIYYIADNYLRNKSSNDEMMPDICEMSRSVLYGKRGGQYIIDAIKDAVVVVENKRLKMAMIRLRGALDAGRSLEDALYEFEGSFTTPEIASFCTVIKSLQTSGHVEEALKTLENNIERAQAGVNKRKCIVLENRTMVYVLLLAFDLLIMILYCIIMKLLDMQIAF